MRFDILNRLSVNHECGRWTNGRTDGDLIAVIASTICDAKCVLACCEPLE